MDIPKTFYCQSQIEERPKCTSQCIHCAEYYKPLEGLTWIEKDRMAGEALVGIRNALPKDSILHTISSKILRKLIIVGIELGLNQAKQH